MVQKIYIQTLWASFAPRTLSEILVEYKDMMKETIKFSVLIFSIGFILCNLVDTSETEVSEFANKIAFLRNGEVWIIDKGGQEIKQVTKTTGKVEYFLFSPTLKYLAYSEIIKYVDEPGLWEKGEKIPQRAVCSIVIMELRNRKILKKLMPPEDNWIYPEKWLPGEKLLFYASSGFEVWGFFEYDVQKNVEREIDYYKGSQLSDADFHRDGSLMVYVDDTGAGEGYRQNLHMFDLKSKDDKILVSKKSIMNPKISFDKKYVAFIEVEWDHANSKGFDNLWIYNIKKGSIEKIYRGPSKAKYGRGLSWSFDNRFIAMFFSPEALVIEIQNLSNIHKIQGVDFNWIENKEIIFAQGNDIYLYNLDTKRGELFFKDASNPAFLWKKK